MPTIKCLFRGCNEVHEIFTAKNGRPYINCSGLANKFYGNNDRSKSMLTGRAMPNPAQQDRPARTVFSAGQGRPVVLEGDVEVDF